LARSSLSLESCTWRAPLFGGDRLVAGIPPGRLAILWSRHGAACDSWGSGRIGRAFSLWHSVQFCWYRGPVSSLDQPRYVTSARGSTGRDWPENPPRSGVLSAGGVLPVEGWDPARPLSGTDARWHDRAPAERRRDRRRAVSNRSPAVPRQSPPTRPWQPDSSSQPAATSGWRRLQWHADRASTETTRR